jgi:hypothetical protein
VSKKFGEWYQKTNKTEDANKLTLLALKIIAILQSTLLATFINLLETVSKGLVYDISRLRDKRIKNYFISLLKPSGNYIHLCVSRRISHFGHFDIQHVCFPYGYYIEIGIVPSNGKSTLFSVSYQHGMCL